MADVYFDFSATTNGDGSFASPYNTYSTANLGERNWIRRNGTISYTSGSFGGLYNALTPIVISGWPEAGDPYYDERPMEARTAWDADPSAKAKFTTTVANFFFLTTLQGASNNLGTFITNLEFEYTGVFTTAPVLRILPRNDFVYMENIDIRSPNGAPALQIQGNNNTIVNLNINFTGQVLTRNIVLNNNARNNRISDVTVDSTGQTDVINRYGGIDSLFAPECTIENVHWDFSAVGVANFGDITFEIGYNNYFRGFTTTPSPNFTVDSLFRIGSINTRGKVEFTGFNLTNLGFIPFMSIGGPILISGETKGFDTNPWDLSFDGGGLIHVRQTGTDITDSRYKMPSIFLLASEIVVACENTNAEVVDTDNTSIPNNSYVSINRVNGVANSWKQLKDTRNNLYGSFQTSQVRRQDGEVFSVMYVPPTNRFLTGDVVNSFGLKDYPYLSVDLMAGMYTMTIYMAHKKPSVPVPLTRETVRLYVSYLDANGLEVVVATDITPNELEADSSNWVGDTDLTSYSLSLDVDVPSNQEVTAWIEFNQRRSSGSIIYLDPRIETTGAIPT